MRRATVLILALILHAPCALSAPGAVRYSVPLDWIRTASNSDVETYQTSHDPSARLFVTVRVVDTRGLSAEAWAMAESETMKREKGLKVGAPQEQYFGDVGWVYVDWADEAGRERGRQYYLDGGASGLASVSLAARDDVFKQADASRFDDFFGSFEWA